MTHLIEGLNFDYADFTNLRVNYLRNAGDRSMAVDGSTTPVLLKYGPPIGFDMYVHRLSGHIIDNLQMNADDFGGINGPLANGVRLYLEGPDEVETYDLLDGTELQRNGDFDTFFTTTTLLSSRGMGFNWIMPVLMRIPDGFKMVATVEDDLTPLIHFEMALHNLLAEKE